MPGSHAEGEMVSTCHTLILSDVHLGSEVSRAQDAMRLLEEVDFRQLILLGDIFSDLNFRRLTGEHWEFLSVIRKLSNPKRKRRIVWVEGNHDHGLSSVMSHLVGIPVYQRYVWEYDGKRHIAVHGHQFDRFVNRNKFLSGCFEQFFYAMQAMDRGNMRLSRWLDRFSTRWLRLSDKVAEGALEYAAEGQAQRIFCGHTHEATTRSRNGVDYFNSGSWQDLRATFITVDLSGVNIHEYQPIAAEPGTRDRDSREERSGFSAKTARQPAAAGLPGDAVYKSLRC